MTSKQLLGYLLITALLILVISPVLAESQTDNQRPHLKILILGGTGFIGPWEVEAAKAHGHEVTLFNRGKSAPNLFPNLEKLVGDRDPEKGDGLKALEGRNFDVVIDNSGYYPRHVKATAELLAPNVGQYIFVSSISAYADPSLIGMDETAPVATMEDETVEEMGAAWENYGPLKALCEAAVEKAMPGRATIVRPGYIVGPGDHTKRFTYWALRVRQGGEVAVPGNPNDPVQVIDARDLANWIIQMAEQNTTGIYNGSGPANVLTMKDIVEAGKEATGSNATFTWLSNDFNEKFPEAQFPIWSPPNSDYAGFHAMSNTKSIKAGLKFRPISETIADILERFDTLPEDKQKDELDRVPVPNEAELIAEAKARK